MSLLDEVTVDLARFRSGRGGSVTAPLRIGNCSGYYGDRADAPYEMLTGGELHVLTGDYLAELTMLILGKDRARDPRLGYAKSFLGQLERSLGVALDRRVPIVVNAGGLNPTGLAERVHELAGRLGLHPRVGWVEGDDLTERATQLGLGTVGEKPVAANAYLGGWGIAECLRAGADVVITGRVTDAALVVGPAAAHFGWAPDDWDRLAGAVVAGHVIECGTQATGGNYCFFTEIPDLVRPGFPIAEIHADGSSVITKHSGTGGAVTLGTVTAQLLYEIGGARYANPDVTARFDTVELAQEGPDRVRISGVRGEPPPPTLKVGVCEIGGYRNEAAFYLTGLDIEAKADLVRAQLAHLSYVPGLEVEWTLARTDHPDSDRQESSTALLHCVVRSPDRDNTGRRFSRAVLELGLASYPGLHRPSRPGEPTAYGRFTATHLDSALAPHTVVLPDGTRRRIPLPPTTAELHEVDETALLPPDPTGPARRVPLGTVAGARSGDKGGSANVGVWVRDDRAWPWLASALTVKEFQRLLPETASLPVTRHVLPNLRALNFVVDGLLGEGVAYQARHDPQAKAVGEWLRSRLVDVPEVLL